MPKTIKWSSYADNDFAKLLEYLESKWNNKVCLDFIENLDYCIIQIQKNLELFPVFNNELQIRKCVVTKHNSIFYRETSARIEILRLYDTRQNPDDLKFF
jgi:plasmid stabilization system protein ParE